MSNGEKPLSERMYRRNGRWWADFRDFADVGGAREGLVPDHESYATRDEETAFKLALARLEELRERRRTGLVEDPLLEEYAERYWQRKLDQRSVRESTITGYRRHLKAILSFLRDELGREPRLSDVDTGAVEGYWLHRLRQPGKGGSTIKKSTVRNELVSLSGVYNDAVRKGRAEVNPVGQLERLPQPEYQEREWLEADEAARLLKAAREMVGDDRSRTGPYFHALIATFLLTGGRRREVFGMERGDVDLEHGEVHFRANSHRRLKRDEHARRVPLWPQLRSILVPYIERHDVVSGLLFPSVRGGGEMLTNVSYGLSTALERAEIDKNVTLHNLRHTYTAARLQTLEHGHPVSPYTVVRELGHKNLDQLMDTYGHVQQRPIRKEGVEYRETEVIDLEAERRERGA